MLTFIIPTIGRKSLSNTITSLTNQTNPNWKAIVVFDGVKAIQYSDSRVTSIEIPKTGKLNHAGSVRNVGIEKANTEWVGFVDDDDTISADYVDKFEEELKENPDAKCIIFRMKMPSGPPYIFPEPHHRDFYKTRVGISFCIKKEMKIKFQASGVEDFELLNKIRENKHKIVISPYITYFVRSKASNVSEINRVIINV